LGDDEADAVDRDVVAEALHQVYCFNSGSGVHIASLRTAGDSSETNNADPVMRASSVCG
jgi:hypothetical protein